MSSPIWYILILIGAVHGLLLGLVLWRKRENRLANRLFALFLLALSYHLGEYALDISGGIFKIPALWLTSYPLLFVFGPLFYLYVKSLLESDFRLLRKDAWHFLPAVLMLLSFMPLYLKSGAEKIAMMMEIGETGFSEIPPEQFVIMIAQILQVCIYLYFSHQLIQHKSKAWKQIRAKNILLRLTWLKQATRAYAAFMLTYAVVTVILLLKDSYRVETDYITALIMASLIFVLGYIAMAQAEIFDHQIPSPTQALKQAEKAPGLKEALAYLMEKEKPYLREEFKVADLAAMLNLPAHQFSEFLRNDLQISFRDYINEFRIQEAKRLLSDPTYNHLKILAVALESGFGNKATFNRVFNKKVGQTPSAFRSQFQK